jgi:hypothetical protein
MFTFLPESIPTKRIIFCIEDKKMQSFSLLEIIYITLRYVSENLFLLFAGVA